MKKVDETLWRLYEIALAEVNNDAEIHRKRLEFYTGLISALFTGLLLGFFNAEIWHHYLVLCIVPILILFISSIGLKDTGRIYKRMLEAITVQAKVEQKLGLTVSDSTRNSQKDQPWWIHEPIVASRHLENRSKYKSSQEFILAQSGQGLQRSTRILFGAFIGLSVILLVWLVFLACWQYLNPCQNVFLITSCP